MNPVRKLEMQCSHAEFLKELPLACDYRPYEIIGDRVIVHDGDKEIQISIHDEPVRHLGSLNLPMEEITMKFVDYSEDDTEKFMQNFHHHLRFGA